MENVVLNFLTLDIKTKKCMNFWQQQEFSFDSQKLNNFIDLYKRLTLDTKKNYIINRVAINVFWIKENNI